MTGYIGIGCIVFALLLALLCAPNEKRVTRPHRGLEIKTRKGRIVHVRETESEREI